MKQYKNDNIANFVYYGKTRFVMLFKSAQLVKFDLA